MTAPCSPQSAELNRILLWRPGEDLHGLEAIKFKCRDLGWSGAMELVSGMVVYACIIYLFFWP